MTSTDQQVSQSEACLASKAVCWLTATRPRNPQASYYRARYYDQNIGRFVSEDAIGFDSGTNFYAYVASDPLDWFDPDGMRQRRKPTPPSPPLPISQITQLVAENNKSGQSDQLIICLIYKESSFYPKGKNPTSSARGLMGVTNRAARSLKVDPRNLSDPATNIRTGCRYLHRRIDWSEPFGSEGSVWEGLFKYGTHTEDYPDSLLECEECMKANPTCSDCQMKQCLMPFHGGH